MAEASIPPAGPLPVVGRYTLHGEIAAGGMATVHVGRLAGAAGFARTVAIKRMHPHLAKDREFVSMFVDEARVAARIHHPNVASTLDVVALDGELFVVLEYVHGESLSGLLRATAAASRTVPLRIALRIATDVLNGLHGAHEAQSEQGAPLGIVHRDVSPQNVLVGTDGVARVIDFGVAKAAGRLQTTRDGQLKGKIAYMAPEQLRGESIDRRCDVYAASVVLWETLTGTRLFRHESEGALVHAVLEADVPPPSSVAKDVPAALDAIALRGLSRNAADRFPTAQAMATALEALGPSATTREVGEWVRAVAAEGLDARATRIAEIESTPHDLAPQSVGARAVSAMPRVPSAAPPSRQDPETSTTIASSMSRPAALGTASKRQRRGAWLAALAILAGMVAVVWAMRGNNAPSAALSSAGAASTGTAGLLASAAPSSPAAVPTTLASAPPSTPVAVAANTEGVAPPASGHPSGATSAHPPPEPSGRPAAATPNVAGRGAATASRQVSQPLPGPATPPKANCDPPYTIDSAGVRAYKRQCIE